MCPCRNSISPRSVCNVRIIFIRPSATDLHYYLWMWFESSRPPPPSTAVASFHALCQMSVLRRHSVGAFTRTHFLCHVLNVEAGKIFWIFETFLNVIRSNCVILTCTLKYTCMMVLLYPYVTWLRSVVRFGIRSPKESLNFGLWNSVVFFSVYVIIRNGR